MWVPKYLGLFGLCAVFAAGQESQVCPDTQILESSTDLWPWLALAGGLGLLAEWVLYGRFRRGMMRSKTMPFRTAAVTGVRK